MRGEQGPQKRQRMDHLNAITENIIGAAITFIKSWGQDYWNPLMRPVLSMS